MAHEINNPLAGILASIQVMRMQLLQVQRESGFPENSNRTQLPRRYAQSLVRCRTDPAGNLQYPQKRCSSHVGTGSQIPGAEKFRLTLDRHEKWARIIIADNGPGMSEAVRKRNE
jgi:signal transduction histidine kinase